jgi:hypothetical protein
MAKTESYPSRQFKRRRNAWMRRNAKVVALVVIGTIALGVFASVLLLTVAIPAHLYVMGATHASLLAAGLHLLNSAFLAHDQQAVWQMRGRGERTTPAANFNGPSASASSGAGWTASNSKPATSTTSS